MNYLRSLRALCAPSVILIRRGILIFQWAPRREGTSIVVRSPMNRHCASSVGRVGRSASSGKRKSPPLPLTLRGKRDERHGWRGRRGFVGGRKGSENGEEWKRRGRLVERSLFTASQNNRVKENVLLLVNGIAKQHCKTLRLTTMRSNDLL